jgi:hypothetical protein
LKMDLLVLPTLDTSIEHDIETPMHPPWTYMPLRLLINNHTCNW